VPRIAIVGAGFGGLGMAMRLVRAGIRDFTIFERGNDVGGTWRENTYPGAGCDVPSHLYSFSFETNPDWSRTYSPQAEILGYLQGCVRKYGLEEHIRFGTGVNSATYDEGANVWHLELSDGSSVAADVLVPACGQLNRPAKPNLDGRESFAGVAFHSAEWRHDVDLDGKRVAVIGTGASAIQFVPEIAPKVSSLTIFQRSAPYVIPKGDRAYSNAAKTLFRIVPIVQAASRYAKYARQESLFLAFSYVRAMMGLPHSWFQKLLATQVADPALRSKLIPDYAMGCKRILISDNYYPALTRENVELVTDAIARITPAGVVTADGRERAFDAIVFGTGFRSTGFIAPMRVTGRDGLDLQTAWKNGAEAFLGITIASFPNFFMIYGPNTNLGHNSIIFMIEAQIQYVMDAIEKLSNGEASRLEVRTERESRYNDRVQRQLARSVWAAGCSSWYLDASGKNTNNWPDFTFVYRARTREVDLRDYMPARD
jgi:cation diffusion facilitator CzcD-associated flavoprotein CzcO